MITITKDTRKWDKIKKHLNKSVSAKLQYGWFDTQHVSGNTNAQIAKLNEEGHTTGTGGISPPRPFLRVGVQKQVPKRLDRQIGNAVKGIMEGNSATSELNKMGDNFVSLVQEVMKEWQAPPNSPLTVLKKGFNDPLIETGHLISSVDYRVMEGGND